MKIQVLVDNPGSWIVPYCQRFLGELQVSGRQAELIHEYERLVSGDVLVLLGCEKILKSQQRALHKFNLVVHESDLPQGKGWSPLTWQVLRGKAVIPVVLFEAAESVDSGVIYEETTISLEGHELVEELRALQAEASFSLIRRFLARYPQVSGQPQEGKESFYPRRREKDSELDVSRTISEQFDLLRVVDNSRYPAFFHFRGHKYVLKIEKVDP